MIEIEKNIDRVLEFFTEEDREFWKRPGRLKDEIDPLKPSPQQNSIDKCELFVPDWIDNNFRGSILLSHFGMSRYELEALGFPIFLTKMLPNAKIDVTYHKHDKINSVYAIDPFGKKIVFKDNLQERYDFVIGRSTSLIKLDTMYHEVFRRSGKKLNIQTNNLTSNMRSADYYFDVNEFFAPADPVFKSCASKTLKNTSKRNIILLSGTVKEEKGQRDWLKKIDPDLIKDYEVYIAGKLEDHRGISEIQEIGRKNGLKIYFLGMIPPNFLRDLMCISKIHVMNHDSRPEQDPIGVSRTHGEGIACKSFPMTPIKSVSVPNEWNHIGVRYDHEDKTSVSASFIEAKKLTQNVEKIEWSHFDFNQMCERIYKISMSLL